MSIYVMTVGELAKKRGEPVGEFVKKIQELGFEAGSHAKKLTQKDLDNIIGLLDNSLNREVKVEAVITKKKATNPNVVMVKVGNKRMVAVVDVTVNDDNTLNTEVLSSSIEDTIGDALLEFRTKLGLNLGVN